MNFNAIICFIIHIIFLIKFIFNDGKNIYFSHLS